MQDSNLQVSVVSGVIPVVRATGELDQESCVAFEAILNDALNKPCNGLHLDLGELSFVDSSGLRILIQAAIRGEKVGCPLNIVSLSPHLDHMLTISDLKRLFNITDIAPEPPTPALPAGVTEPLGFTVPKSKGVCKEVRDQVNEFALNMGFDILALDDIKLAVGEAISNAVRHGTDCGSDIEVKCKEDGAKLIVTLRYPSVEFDPHAVPAPTHTTASEGGMGIHFMKLVMDKVHYEFRDGHTELTLEKKLRD